jgi:peptidoglycan/xylan/chitin deacetylase (PgdA/CDA1 family)
MKILICFLLILIELLSFGQKKQVCFSFDDLPIVSYGMDDTSFQNDLFDKLIFKLKTNEIPAIGFINEKKLFKNGSLIYFQQMLLENWVKSGLDLGNHTYSHPDYNITSFQDYCKDILKGETVTRKILKQNGKPLKYFRHPFLHMGNTKAKSDSLTDFLSKHGYKIAPVTIDNDDYLFALAYKRAYAAKDSILKLKIGHDYIIYMEKKLNYFEKQAVKLFGRNINQILLLHSSLLNSEYIDSLANMYRKNNYDFVSMDKTLEDEVYETKITEFSDWGISWIDRWALTQGKKGDFFKDEPATPDYIKKLAN